MNKETILKLMGMLGGRKFIITIISTLIITFVPGLDQTLVAAIAGIAASFILGQGYADGMSAGATSTTTKKEED